MKIEEATPENIARLKPYQAGCKSIHYENIGEFITLFYNDNKDVLEIVKIEGHPSPTDYGRFDVIIYYQMKEGYTNLETKYIVVS